MGKRVKNKSKKFVIRRFVFSVISLIIIFFIGFFSSWKISEKKYAVVTAKIIENNISINDKNEKIENNIGSGEKIEEKENLESQMNRQKELSKEENEKKEKAKLEEKKQVALNGEKSNEKSTPVLNPYISDGNKIAYLTFDDGPSATVTPKVLDVLKQYNIKATFFVVGIMVDENKELLIRTKNEGHAIGNHSYSHNYNHIYANINNFIGEINRNNELIKNVLNQKEDVKLIRFPGGSFGQKLEPYRKAIQEAGYCYVDWNCLNGDAEGIKIPPDRLLSRLKETAAGQEHLVILMHDAPGKETTVQALPSIIEYLKSQGYTFKLLQ